MQDARRAKVSVASCGHPGPRVTYIKPGTELSLFAYACLACRARSSLSLSLAGARPHAGVFFEVARSRVCPARFGARRNPRPLSLVFKERMALWIAAVACGFHSSVSELGSRSCLSVFALCAPARCGCLCFHLIRLHFMLLLIRARSRRLSGLCRCTICSVPCKRERGDR